MKWDQKVVVIQDRVIITNWLQAWLVASKEDVWQLVKKLNL